MRTLEQQLADIDAAIEKIESGAQEYSIGARRVRRADLASLYAQRDKILWQIAARDGRDYEVVNFDRR